MMKPPKKPAKHTQIVSIAFLIATCLPAHGGAPPVKQWKMSGGGMLAVNKIATRKQAPTGQCLEEYAGHLLTDYIRGAYAPSKQIYAVDDAPIAQVLTGPSVAFSHQASQHYLAASVVKNEPSHVLMYDAAAKGFRTLKPKEGESVVAFSQCLEFAHQFY